MRKGLVWLLSLVFLRAAYIHGGIQQSANTAGLCTVGGTVINSSTRLPIRKARVRINSAQGEALAQTILTAADGRFEFLNIPAGRYRLQAEATGYVNRTDEVPWITLTLGDGDQRHDLILPLFPEAVIAGRVYDEDGDPVMGAQVWAFIPVYSDHRRRFVLTGEGGMAETNERGEYRLFDLSPGTYTLVVTYQRRDDPRMVAISPTFYPGVSDPDQSTSVNLRPGDDLTEINFNLVVVPAVCVRGKATMPSTSKTLNSPFVELIPQSGWALPWMVSSARYLAQTRSAKGDFQFCGVPPGSYIALASANDRTRENFYQGRSPVDVGSMDVEGVNVPVDPVFDVRGRVRTEPAAKLDFSRVRVYLRSQDRDGSGANAQVNADGTFSMHHVADASYLFLVRGFPAEFYVKSAHFGGADLLAPGQIVTYGMSSGILEVVLSPNGGRVDGRVVNDDMPVTDAEVVSVPDEAHRDREEFYSSTRSDSMGKFTLFGLPPGDFTLYAFEKTKGESIKDPEFLRRTTGKGTTIHIEEKEQKSVQLNLIQKTDQPC